VKNAHQSESCLGMAIHCAKKYKGLHPQILKRELDDLIGEAFLGLVVAENKYDSDRVGAKSGRKAKYSTVAYWWVRAYLTDYLDKRKVQSGKTAGRNLVYLWDGKPRDHPIWNLIVDKRVSDLDRVDSEDEAEWAVSLLRTLPPRDRLIMELHYLDGLTHEQIAGLFGLTRTAVTQVAQRSLCKLREVIKDRENNQ